MNATRLYSEHDKLSSVHQPTDGVSERLIMLMPLVRPLTSIGDDGIAEGQVAAEDSGSHLQAIVIGDPNIAGVRVVR